MIIRLSWLKQKKMLTPVSESINLHLKRIREKTMKCEAMNVRRKKYSCTNIEIIASQTQRLTRSFSVQFQVL